MCDFTNALAHDLKSPLNRARAYSSLIQKKLSGKDIDLIKHVSDDIEYMSRFTDKLLLFAEYGTAIIANQKVDLNIALKKAMDNLEIDIKKSKALIKIQNILPQICGDEISLIRLFQNLISNSIKYCSNQPIIEIKSEIDKYGQKISILDNGIGIDDKNKSEIFKPLVRLENSLGKEGAGLGLALCKSIIDKHYGNINISSRKEGGCEIQIIFSNIIDNKSGENLQKTNIFELS